MRTALLILALLVFPGAASAIPLTVVGFGDSITCDTCNDGSYLSLLQNYLPEAPVLDDHGVSADPTSNVLTRLGVWLGGGPTADVVIILSGTPDLFMDPGGFLGLPYDEAATVANIGAMLGLLNVAGIPAILAAPPPVQPPCDFVVVPTCATIGARAASLSTELDLLASGLGVPFVNLYDAFQADPDIGEVPGTPASLFRGDGVHPQYLTGDDLIAFEISQAIVSVPEPSTGVLFALGVVLITATRRRR